MATLSGINAVFSLAILPLFPTPIQLQGFATDDSFDVEDVEPNETLIGVDGILSGGRVAYQVPMMITLQADSASNAIFDQWNAAEQVLQDSYIANGLISLKTVSSKWTLTRGFLTRFKPIPQVKKLLQPRHYRITWNSVIPSPA